MRAYVLTGIAAPLFASPAVAQERYFNFAVRGGLDVAPSYPGASTYETSPDLGLTFGALKWGRLDSGNGIGGVPENGLTANVAFRVLGDRNSIDNPELAGLTHIDAAVELGLGLTYQETNWAAYGALRKGLTGHSGVTGDLGANLIFRPSDRLTLTAGPKISFGDGEFASTYFGVTAAEAGASNFAAYNASGGALGAGFSVGARYELNENWAVDGALGYEKLIGDAGDSPITAAGDDDQWTLRIGLSREFTLRF